MHAARGVSDEMLDGQVRLGGTFRHIWASRNIAISPHSNYKDLSEYRHNRSSLHPCSVRDGPRSLPHLPAGRAQPKGQSQRRSMRHFLAVAAPHHSTRNSAQRQAAKKGLSAFRNGPISAWRGGPLKCAGVCVCSPPRPRSFQPMSGGGVRATQESSRFLLLVSVLWVCGQRVCVVQAKRHIHSPPGTPLSDQRRPEGGPGGG